MSAASSSMGSPEFLKELDAASSSMGSPKFLKELDEEGETQEFKDFLSSLPTEKSILTQVYQYQGFWHGAQILKGILKFQTQFLVQPSDLYLVTTPKSGTTWLKAISFAIVNRVRYSPQQHQHPLLVKNPHELVPFVEFMYVKSQDPDFMCFGSQRLFATHLPYVSLPEPITGLKCKIVYLCRDPKDILVSLWCFIKKLIPNNLETNLLEDVFERFCEGHTFFGPFWDHVLGYWNQSLEEPERVFFLRFEDMKREPIVYLRKLAHFLGFPFSTEEENEGVLEEILKLCSFENLSNLEVNKKGKLSSGITNNAFFRHGKMGDWANHLTLEMIERLDQIAEKKFHGSGLKF